MHTSGIRHANVAASGRLLATVADDKTLRLWSTTTREAVRVLRPPIVNGLEGMLYAVALSPDARLVATGGETGFAWAKEYCIYVFDTSTGAMVRKIGGMPSAPTALAWSQDGQVLAVGFSGNGGLRFWQTETWQQIAEDRAYNDSATWIDFSKEGVAVTTSADGFLRLYDNRGRRTARVRPTGKAPPTSAVFAPGGDRLAVGYTDALRVDVLSAGDLKPLYAPNLKGLSGGNLAAIAWTGGGDLLAAGTAGAEAGYNPVFRWTDLGRGKRSPSLGTFSAVAMILPLPDGSLVGTSYDPPTLSWIALKAAPPLGVLAAAFEPSRSADIFDFESLGDVGLLASRDGNTIRTDRAKFSIPERLLEVWELGGAIRDREKADLFPPIIANKNIPLSKWDGASDLKLAGRKLVLDPGEYATALAIAADGKGFLVGTEFKLRRFAADGIREWELDLPASARMVNISRDGRIAIAALADGTIRWYRWSDGQELLSLFLHVDGKHWVLWTPDGYFDAAPGAEDKIGWHVNNGSDQAADFFPAGRFREQFHRPDIVDLTLQALDPAQAAKRANQTRGSSTLPVGDEFRRSLPPIINILSPEPGAVLPAGRIELRYHVRSPSNQPITAVRILINGRPLIERGIALSAPKQGERTLQFELPAGESTVSLIAEADQAVSEAATITLKGTAPDGAEAVKRKLYVLSIGVSRYREPSYNLTYAAKDAKDIVAFMKRQSGLMYRDVEARVLTDVEATTGNVLDAMDWLEKSMSGDDIAILFLAGHGVNDGNGDYYFLPFEADVERLRRTAVSHLEIRNTLAKLPGTALFLIDTCHAANVLGQKRGLVDINKLANELSSAENGVVVMSAATARQSAIEDAAWGNGAFTRALLDGLGGKADFLKDGRITLNELDLYVSGRVKEMTQGRQTPTTAKPNTIRDFPLALAR